MNIAIPKFFNIGEACTRPDVSPESIALIIDDQRAEEISEPQKLSYRQLDRRSDAFGAAMQNLGYQEQDRILLCLPNCLAFPLAFFGALKAGMIAVPASVKLTPEELHYLILDSGADILVTTREHWHALSGHYQSIEKLTLKDVVLVDGDVSEEPHNPVKRHGFDVLIDKGLSLLGDEDFDFSCATTRADDPAYLVYTSGTTGYPKGVLHAHRALLGRLPASKYWFNYGKSGDRILHSGKFNWTYVLGTALMDPLYLGQTVVVYEGDGHAAVWPELIARHRCSIFIGVPTIYRQILQKTLAGKKDVPTLRHCMCAGEHLSDEVLNSWQSRFGLAIYEAIGMSECSYYLSQPADQPIRPGSAGFVQPGHMVELLDEDMLPVDDEEEGMLCIDLQDPGLFLEYWQRSEETAESHQAGYFLTGDYAHRDAEGYIWFHGRKDDMINSFGFRLSPVEIERVLKGHEKVADCVVLGQSITPEKVLVVACVIPQPGVDIEEGEILDYARQHLAEYKVPKAVHVMSDFPRTANGKVIRNKLKAALPRLA